MKIQGTLGSISRFTRTKIAGWENERQWFGLRRWRYYHVCHEPCMGTKEAIYMSYDKFAEDVEVGEKVLVDDGKLEFEVVETNGKDKVKLKTLLAAYYLPIKESIYRIRRFSSCNDGKR